MTITLFEAHRSSELCGAIPNISQRMLFQTLRGLEPDGVLTRETQDSVPPQVNYALTPLGKSYIEPLQPLLSLGAKHQERFDVIRRTYDAEAAIKTAR